MGIKERKEREKEARREEIIDAAEKVFFRKGLQAATVDEIAEEVELSKGTIYLYCKSKEDLYMAVILRGSEIMYQMFKAAVSTGEPTLILIRNLGRAYFEFFQKYRHYYRMFYFFENPQSHSQVSEEMMEMCSVSDQRIWALVIGLIQRGIDEGLLHADLDPKEAAVMLWSNSNGLMRLMDRDDKYFREQMGIDLEATLRKSNAFLVEAMMSDQALKEHGSLFPHHEYRQPNETKQGGEVRE